MKTHSAVALHTVTFSLCWLLALGCQTRADVPPAPQPPLTSKPSTIPLFAAPRSTPAGPGLSVPARAMLPELPRANVAAPIEIHLTHSGPLESMDLMLEFKLERDAPSVKVRFVVPKTVAVLEGELEHDFGALSSGQGGTLQLKVRVPSEGLYTLAAGVDLQISSGVRLHKSDAIRVGAAAR